MAAVEKVLVFDRLVGTYAAERTDVSCLHGWTKPPASYNLLSIVAAEWRSLARELAQARGIAEPLVLLLMPPAWPHTDRVRALGERGLRRQHAAARADWDTVAQSWTRPPPSTDTCPFRNA